jgi:hypothetical protein
VLLTAAATPENADSHDVRAEELRAAVQAQCCWTIDFLYQNVRESGDDLIAVKKPLGVGATLLDWSMF